MQTLSPSAYADRYLNMTIPSPTAGQPDIATGISVGKYLIGAKHSDSARSQLLRRVEKNFAEAKKHKVKYSVRVRVDRGGGDYSAHTFDSLVFKLDNPLYRLLRYPFGGKGSPEAIQVVLQVATSAGPTGEAPLITPGQFQKYCDDWLGVDCNGFVGNFLRNEKYGDDDTWWKVESSRELGPQNTIDSLFQLAPGVARSKASEVNFNDYNLFAEVDATSGRIIPGGSGPDGHTGISEPGRVNHLVTASPGPLSEDVVRVGHRTYTPVTGAPNNQILGVWTIESTGPQRVGGVRKSFYQIFDHPEAAKSPKFKGVFRVYRGVKRQFLDMRIKAILS